MNTEKLIIRNFLSIKNVEIDLGKYNVFIGEQSSGKSLMLKHLYFFREITNSYLIKYFDLESFLSAITIRYHDIFKLPFIKDSYVEYSINGYTVYIYNTNIIKFSENLSELIKPYFDAQRTLRLNSLGFLGLDGDASTHITNSFNKVIQQVYNQSYINLGIDTFIPASRSIIYSLLDNTFHMLKTGRDNLNLDYLLMQFGADYQKSRRVNADYNELSEKYTQYQLFEKLASQILKGKFVHNHSNADSTMDYIQHDKYATQITNASSGQQEFIPIYLVLKDLLLNNNLGNIYIEEPEAHLYPGAQSDITQLLIYAANFKNYNNLYITTHSPYVLTVLNNLILANEVGKKQDIYDKKLLINFDEVRAYYIEDGLAKDLRDHETHLIMAENLDSISTKTATDFDKLLSIKYDDYKL